MTSKEKLSITLTPLQLIIGAISLFTTLVSLGWALKGQLEGDIHEVRKQLDTDIQAVRTECQHNLESLWKDHRKDIDDARDARRHLWQKIGGGR